MKKRFPIHPPSRGGDYERQDQLRIDEYLRAIPPIDAGTGKLGETFPKKRTSLAETKRQPFDAAFNRHR